MSQIRVEIPTGGGGYKNGPKNSNVFYVWPLKQTNKQTDLKLEIFSITFWTKIHKGRHCDICMYVARKLLKIDTFCDETERGEVLACNINPQMTASPHD